jgi:hypothetical protein
MVISFRREKCSSPILVLVLLLTCCGVEQKQTKQAMTASAVGQQGESVQKGLLKQLDIKITLFSMNKNIYIKFTLP